MPSIKERLLNEEDPRAIFADIEKLARIQGMKAAMEACLPFVTLQAEAIERVSRHSSPKASTGADWTIRLYEQYSPHDLDGRALQQFESARQSLLAEHENKLAVHIAANWVGRIIEYDGRDRLTEQVDRLVSQHNQRQALRDSGYS